MNKLILCISEQNTAYAPLITLLSSNSSFGYKVIQTTPIHIVGIMQHPSKPLVRFENRNVVSFVTAVPAYIVKTVNALVDIMPTLCNVNDDGIHCLGMTDNDIIDACSADNSIWKRLKRKVRGIQKEILCVNSPPQVTQHCRESVFLPAQWIDTNGPSELYSQKRGIHCLSAQHIPSKRIEPTTGRSRLPLLEDASSS